MKVCFFGLGSIGKRHLKNLASVCKDCGTALKVHAVRSHPDALPEDISCLIERQVSDTNMLDESYDAAFITNPTSMHYQTLMGIAGRCRCFFIEKPVFDSCRCDVSKIPLRDDAICYVAAPLRFTSVLRYMKDIAKEQTIYAVRSISSSYLPEWRPNQDYRTVYSAKKSLGGGVKIDLIHEWDYLTGMFGFPDEVHCLWGTNSHLEIDSEDIAVYIAAYPKMTVELHLDYFGRKTQRSVTFFTKEGTIMGDIAGSKIVFDNGDDEIAFKEDVNDKYVREMIYFIDLVTGRQVQSINTIEHALRVMQTAEGIAR